MNGRWWVRRRGERVVGRPWLILRSGTWEALQWNGPVLQLNGDARLRLGPDILAVPPDFEAMLRNLRRDHQAREVGDALLDQRLVAGVGNVWKAEALWAARLSPWRPLAELSNVDLRGALESAAALMRAALEGRRPRRNVAARAGRPCPRCGTPIRSLGQGDGARTAHWCPTCQPREPKGGPAPGAS